jgi:hypothetical protein
VWLHGGGGASQVLGMGTAANQSLLQRSSVDVHCAGRGRFAFVRCTARAAGAGMRGGASSIESIHFDPSQNIYFSLTSSIVCVSNICLPLSLRLPVSSYIQNRANGAAALFVNHPL